MLGIGSSVCPSLGVGEIELRASRRWTAAKEPDHRRHRSEAQRRMLGKSLPPMTIIFLLRLTNPMYRTRTPALRMFTVAHDLFSVIADQTVEPALVPKASRSSVQTATLPAGVLSAPRSWPFTTSMATISPALTTSSAQKVGHC
jgi:hypothetical protein